MRAALIKRLWSDGTIAALAEGHFLAETQPASVDPTEFVLRLTANPVILAPAEWCSRMWQVATARILGLLAALARKGLTLESVRPDFMLSAGSSGPVYSRPGAIAPADDGP